MIANALAESQVKFKRWRLPTEPAFTVGEVSAIEEWVKDGGSLFLIADHMPMPGAVEELAAAFGLLFGNGYAIIEPQQFLITFTPDTGLADHPITRGRTDAESVDSVLAFGGQAFRSERPVEPLLTLPSGSTLLLPVQAGEFKDTTAEGAGHRDVPGRGLSLRTGTSRRLWRGGHVLRPKDNPQRRGVPDGDERPRGISEPPVSAEHRALALGAAGGRGLGGEIPLPC